MKQGEKYIIEIERVLCCTDKMGIKEFAVIKGFNTLVFDEFGLKRLQKYDGTTKEDYRQGFMDGWNVRTNEG